MIGCLRTRVRKQPIIALHFESENVLKFYYLEARFKKKIHSLMESNIQAKTINDIKVKPWISKQVKSLTRKCKKLFAKQRKTRKA